MLSQGLRIRWFTHDRIALFTNVGIDQRLHSCGRKIRDQAESQRCGGLICDRVAGGLAHTACPDSANIDRRIHDQPLKTLAAAFRPSKREILAQELVDRWSRRYRGQRLRAWLSYRFGKSIDQDLTIRGAHAGQQMHQHHDRVWRPVPIMPAVQLAQRPIDGDICPGYSAHPKTDQLPAGLVHRPIAEQPEIGLQQVRVPPNHVRKMRRAGFLLAIEKEFEIDRDWNIRRRQRIDRAQQANDRRFVVTCRARVQAPLAGDFGGQGTEIDRCRIIFEPAFAQYRLPGVGRPQLTLHRLAIVVRVNQHRVRGAPVQFAKNNRRAARRFKQSRLDASSSHHLHDELGIPTHIGMIRRHVPQSQQLHKFADDSALVSAVVRPRCGYGLDDRRPGVRCPRHRWRTENQQRATQPELCIPDNENNSLHDR